MIELPFFRHFQFSMDLERIGAAFDASIATMEQTYRAAEEASEHYEESGEDDDEYDEDGALIHSKRDNLRWQVLQASQAQTVIRQVRIVASAQPVCLPVPTGEQVSGNPAVTRLVSSSVATRLTQLWSAAAILVRRNGLGKRYGWSTGWQTTTSSAVEGGQRPSADSETLLIRSGARLSSGEALAEPGTARTASVSHIVAV